MCLMLFILYCIQLALLVYTSQIAEIRAVAARTGEGFSNEKLLLQALTHRTFDGYAHNGRLSLLGKIVLVCCREAVPPQSADMNGWAMMGNLGVFTTTTTFFVLFRCRCRAHLPPWLLQLKGETVLSQSVTEHLYFNFPNLYSTAMR